MQDKKGKLSVLIRNLRIKRYEKYTIQRDRISELQRRSEEDKPKS